MPPRAHAADEDLGVERVTLHANAIAEDRPATERRIGVRGDHRHRAIELPQKRDEHVDQGRLTRAGRAGETDYIRLGPVLQRLLEGPHRWIAFFDEADGTGEGADVAGAEALGQYVDWLAPLTCPASGARSRSRSTPPTHTSACRFPARGPWGSRPKQRRRSSSPAIWS